jgi:uncharacterized protein (DUF952 family)
MIASKPIFHIAIQAEYEPSRSSGEYVPSRFEHDGFIHCSYADQLLPVADHLFQGRSDLVLLEIDRNKVDAEVIDENLEGGSELYPHIYGQLPTSAIVKVHEFPSKKDGTFELPTTVET